MQKHLKVLTLSIVMTALIVTACTGGQTSTPTTPEVPATTEPTGFRPAAHYATLFEQDRSFRYRFEHRNGFYDPEDSNADDSGMVITESSDEVTCQVAEVRRFDEAIASRITCECPQDPHRGCLLDGVYVATSRGINEIDQMPSSAEQLTEMTDANRNLRGYLYLSADPRPREAEYESDEPGFGSALAIRPLDGGGWCWSFHSWGGDESSRTICFTSDGFVRSIVDEFAGGSIIERRMTLLR